ncbi:MAG: ABC transporter ATP-binding protein [Halodesulfovibrio sp.]|uniref:ABC transporter ATP-binding protein n=1 Tax=Halodesulfovibrio sp. TaxID=1912772 RepID=UPI00359DC579
MNTTPIITLENVGCTYTVRKGFLKMGKYEALKNVSFSINRGETVGIIGRNGAGKSTLLRLVAGVIQPDSGNIIRHTAVSISLLTLQLGFSAELTGRDNAILGAMFLGHSRKNAIASLNAINDFAELGQWFNEPLKSYSSGMKARLGFAVAVEMSPDVLLVDEVLGVGDESFRKKSTAVMKEKMLSGQTVLFVSHNSNTIKELCTSVVWIENGVTKMAGNTNEVLTAYTEYINTNRKI